MPSTTYKVRSGDTLASIASRLLGSPGKWRMLADLNHLDDPNRLRTGQTLKIPSMETHAAPVVVNPRTPPASGGTGGVQFLERDNQVFAVAEGSADEVRLGKLYKKGLYRVGRFDPTNFLEAHRAEVRKLKLSESEIDVLLGTSDNEGNLDAVNTWDNSFLSFGIFQWTAGAGDGKGELAALLALVQATHLQEFKNYWGQFGLGVTEDDGVNGRLTLDGKTLRTAASKETLREYPWVLRFVRAGSDEKVQAVQFLHAIRRVDRFYFEKQSKLAGRSLSELLTSSYAVALLLDQDVNRPAHVAGCVRQAIADVGTTVEALAASTTQLERKVIKRYLSVRETFAGARGMTDSAQRAKTTQTYLASGRLSEERGSFRSNRASRA